PRTAWTRGRGGRRSRPSPRSPHPLIANQSTPGLRLWVMIGSMAEGGPVVVFFPEGAYGPTNNCVGIAQVLRERGARVVFVVEESFAGTLEARGFEEALMRLKPKPEVDEEPGQQIGRAHV